MPCKIESDKSLIRSPKSTKLCEKQYEMAFLLVKAVKRDLRQPLMFEELLPRYPKSLDLISPSAPELVPWKLIFALQIPFLPRLIKKQTEGGRLCLAFCVGCAAL